METIFKSSLGSSLMQCDSSGFGIQQILSPASGNAT